MNHFCSDLKNEFQSYSEQSDLGTVASFPNSGVADQREHDDGCILAICYSCSY